MKLPCTQEANAVEKDKKQAKTDLGKKPYHRPNLRVCGELQERTRTGYKGTAIDAEWSYSGTQS
jgi:hypothetical protein